jgi:hypothetical protein
MANKWKKLNSNNQSTNWKPTKVGDEVSGVYVDKRENVGPNHSMVYELQQEDGSFVSIWGKTVIDSSMARVQLGDTVKIVFTGESPNKNGTRTFKTFDVFVLDSKEENTNNASAEDVAADDIPF